jgi:hypothetical protein
MLKKLSLLITAVCIVITANAGNDKNISSLIRKELSVPATLKNDKLDEKVNVQFRLAENGKATIIRVETSNPELKNYILDEFPKMDFNTVTEKKEQIYFVDINFKVL